MTPELEAQLDELVSYKNNLMVEISSRELTENRRRFKFTESSTDELKEGLIWVRAKIDELLAPFERDDA